MSNRWLFSGLLVCFCAVPAFSQVTEKIFNLASSHREILDDTIDPLLCPDPPDDCHCKPSAAHDTGHTGVFKEGSYVGKDVNGNTLEFMNWRMVYPTGYNPTNPTKYPMIVMLHGAGEGGRKWNGNFDYGPTDPRYDNNGRNISHGGTQHRDAVARNPNLSNSFPGIVIWPQASYNGAWEGGWDSGNMSDNTRMVANIIEFMIEDRNVDPDRIVMHGLSNGAQGVWDLAAKRPDLFAAILPMSGVGTNLTEMVNRLVTTPIWIFQGSTDLNPNPSASLDWQEAFNDAGGNMLRTVYQGVGHGTWNNAYGEANFFPYIKSKTKKDIYVFGGNPSVCPGGTLRLGFSANFLAYQWTRDGDDIPGATAREYGAQVGGVYRVKYQRRNDGSWAESNPVTVTSTASSNFSPLLKNTGSTFIPVTTLVNSLPAPLPSVKNFVYLQAPAGFATYQWYKNGLPMSPPTTTTNERLVSQDAGVSGDQGTYTVKVVSGCVSDFSNPITLTWFSPQPTSPAAAKATTTVLSSTSLNVSWPDYGNEIGYEVWRYRHATIYGEQNWTQITALPANTLSFIDTGLRPGGFYKYVIRPLFSNGSAICSPEGPDSWGIPSADNIPPTAPNALAATNITNSGLTLSWLPSTDNDKVYQYEVYTGSTLLQTITGNINDSPPTATTVNLTGLAPSTTYLLNVRGIDKSGNVSPFAEGISVTTESSNGVFYKYWTFTGTMPGATSGRLVEPRTSNSWDFGQTPVKTGNITIFDLTQRTQNDRFVFAFDALVEILTAGTYTFYTTSASGSRLYINGSLIVNNDGDHNSQERSGTVTLGVGKHAIRVTYFDQTRTETLTVSYAGPGVTKIAIPAARLYLPPSNPGLLYYSLPTGDLADVNTWGVNPNGSGAHPPNFTNAVSFYNIANRTSTTLSNPWTVSGSGSRVVVGTGSSITFDINAALTGTVEAKDAATININNATIPSFGVLASTSTVNFNTGSNVVIPNGVYGNVSLVSENQYTIPTSNTTILGNLSVANNVTTTGVSTNTSRLIIGGNITFSNSSNPLPGTPANQYSVVFTGGVTHNVSFNTPVDPNFFAIQADVGDVVNFVNAGVHTYTVGSTLGGGIVNKGTINLGNSNLVVSGRGSINANNETGILSINGGNLTLNSTATLNSNLNFDATNNVINNLSVTLPSTYNANVLSPAVVNNLVSLSGGGNIVTGDGNIKLTSTPTGTARIGPLGNGSRINGNIIAQRHMEAEGVIFRYISIPVKGVKVADLQAFFPVTGNFTGASTGPGLNGNPSMFDYSEPTGGYRQFPPIGGTNQDTLRMGRGYSAFIREGAIPTTLEVKGAPNQGNVSYPLTAGTSPTDGWNLVGNPYAAPIRWTGGSSGGWTMSGVNNTVSVRENYSATGFRYRTWNGTTGNLASGIIAPGQAFWVQTTNASPSLVVGETAKQTSDGIFYREGDPENVIAIKMKAGSLEDDTYIQFHRDATPLFEKQFDATKLSNSFFNISTLTSDNKSVAINLTTSGQCDQTVNFRTTNAAVGSYQLIISGVGSLVAGEEVIFTDSFTSTTVTLGAEDFTHNFSITSTPASKADGRFKLKFIKPGVTYENTLASEAACNNSDPVVTIHNSQPGVDYKAFVDGVQVSGVAVGNGGNLTLPVNHNMLPYGKTNLQLTAGFLGCQQFDLTNTINVTRDTVDAPEIEMNQGVLSLTNLDGVETQWFFEDELIEGATLGEYTPIDSGAYRVQVTKASCVLTSNTLVKLPLHLNLPVTSQAVCNDNAVIVIENTQPGVKYQAFFGSIDASSFVIGTGGPLSISLDESVINTGQKDIKIKAGFENDIPQFLAQNVVVQRNVLTTPQVFVDGTKLKTNVTGDEFKWYLDNEQIEGATSNEIDFITEGSYSVEVKSGVCAASSSTLPLTFSINTSISANSQAQCESNSLVTVEDSQPGVTYAAYYNGALISDEVIGTGNDITLTVNTSIGFGQKQLTIKAGYLNNQKHDLTNPVTVNRQFLAVPNVTVSEEKLVVDIQDAQYTWFMNGEELAGEHSSSFEPTESGSYYVVVSNGICTKQSLPVEYSVTGIGDEIAATLTLSPNPARTKVVVVAPRSIDLATLKLLTATGQAFAVPVSQLGDRSVEMDISGLSAGFYLVHVNGQAIRLVKE